MHKTIPDKTACKSIKSTIKDQILHPAIKHALLFCMTTSHTQHKHTAESGNVIWLIMIGVALLAALAMTLSRTESNVESSGKAEKRSIEALYIMRYAKSIETAVQKLKFQDISENDISFENTGSTLDYENTNCTDNSCKIFHIQGAGLSYLKPKADWLDSTHASEDHFGEWIFTGNSCVPKIGTGDDETCSASANQLELIAILPYIKTSLCQQINKLSNITITSDNPPVDDGDAWDSAAPQFIGSFTDPQNIADSNEDLFGQATGCFGGGGTPDTGTNHFYHVILAR